MLAYLQVSILTPILFLLSINKLQSPTSNSFHSIANYFSSRLNFQLPKPPSHIELDNNRRHEYLEKSCNNPGMGKNLIQLNKKSQNDHLLGMNNLENRDSWPSNIILDYIYTWLPYLNFFAELENILLLCVLSEYVIMPNLKYCTHICTTTLHLHGAI